MKLYRNSSQKAHRMLVDAPVSATGVPEGEGLGPARVTVQLGYSSPLTNYYLRLTIREAREQASRLTMAANMAEGKRPND